MHGQKIHTIKNINVKELDDGTFEWDSVELPPAKFDYDTIVNALITLYYPNDKMQAVINNYLMDKENKNIVAEFNDMQLWRVEAKEIAMALLEEMKIEKEEVDRK